VGFQFWWPAGHQLQKSGGQAQILVAKEKKIGSQHLFLCKKIILNNI
jgi:hypothetical protein